jgi:hypothetical protein
VGEAGAVETVNSSRFFGTTASPAEKRNLTYATVDSGRHDDGVPPGEARDRGQQPWFVDKLELDAASNRT